MSMQRMIVGVIWLLAGVLIVAISLVRGQREAVWGANELGLQKMMTLKEGWMASGSAMIGDEDEVLPGEWRYLAHVTHDWLWLRLAPDSGEQAGRLLQIANERLHSGWKVGKQGEMTEALKTLTKAEGYLSEAAKECQVAGKWCEEVVKSARIHEQLLKEMEMEVSDQMRPRVTVLLNVPRGIN